NILYNIVRSRRDRSPDTVLPTTADRCRPSAPSPAADLGFGGVQFRKRTHHWPAPALSSRPPAQAARQPRGGTTRSPLCSWWRTIPSPPPTAVAASQLAPANGAALSVLRPSARGRGHVRRQ